MEDRLEVGLRHAATHRGCRAVVFVVSDLPGLGRTDGPERRRRDETWAEQQLSPPGMAENARAPLGCRRRSRASVRSSQRAELPACGDPEPEGQSFASSPACGSTSVNTSSSSSSPVSALSKLKTVLPDAGFSISTRMALRIPRVSWNSE